MYLMHSNQLVNAKSEPAFVTISFKKVSNKNGLAYIGLAISK